MNRRKKWQGRRTGCITRGGPSQVPPVHARQRPCGWAACWNVAWCMDDLEHNNTGKLLLKPVSSFAYMILALQAS